LLSGGPENFPIFRTGMIRTTIKEKNKSGGLPVLKSFVVVLKGAGPESAGPGGIIKVGPEKCR